MEPSRVSIDGAAAVYLFAASEGAFIGATSVLILLQTFSMFMVPDAVVGAVGGVLFARRYIRSNDG
ncbi:hypothetical protein GCM10028857_08680 [Salinarchaeum chitinilyticum]